LITLSSRSIRAIASSVSSTEVASPARKEPRVPRPSGNSTP
jgi:hypothetical protein